jgi:Na+-transporting methylmalonyl-CoA/oxaloacetate decarboxylase gamma subunit
MNELRLRILGAVFLITGVFVLVLGVLTLVVLAVEEYGSLWRRRLRVTPPTTYEAQRVPASSRRRGAEVKASWHQSRCR